MNFFRIFLSLFILNGWVCSSMGISLTYPFLVSNSQANVNYITCDFEGNVFVALDNGQMLKSTSTLITFSNLALGVTAIQLLFSSLAYSIVLQDSTQLTGNAQCMTSKDSNGYGISVFDYVAYSMKYQYTLNQSIIDYYVFPINSGSKTTYLIVVFTPLSIKVLYEGLERWVLLYPAFAGIGITLSSCAFKNEGITTSFVNLLILSSKFHFSLSNKNMYSIDIQTTLNHNATTGQFDFQQAHEGIVYLQSFSYQITFIGYQNNFLIEQESSGAIHSYIPSQYFIVSVNSAIPIATINQFLWINNKYYLLQNNAFLEIVLIIDTVNNSYEWQFVSLLSSIPANNYRLVFITVDLALLYILGSPLIHKAGQCLDYTVLINGSCQNYLCNDIMCTDCPINPNICGSCGIGYMRSPISYTCQIASFSSNATVYPSDLSQYEVFINFLIQMIQKLKIVIVNTIQIPGARRILTPVFFYFGNFDDLYLYQFHDRTYGPTMKYVFALIADIENSKWSLLNAESLLQEAADSFWKNLTNSQSTYLSYVYQSGQQLGSEGLLANSLTFFTILTPVTIIGYILIRIIWYLSRSFRFSFFLRQFSCGLFLVALLFEGNIQQFSFYLSAQFSHFFVFNATERILKIAFALFGFIVLIVATGGMIMSLAIYRKLNRCLMENYKNNIYGVLWLTLLAGLRNIVLGSMHYFLRWASYFCSLLILLSVEFIFSASLVFLIWQKKIFHYRAKVWLILLLTYLRMLLFISFQIDYYSIGLALLEQSQQVILCIMLFVYLVGFIHEIVSFLSELASKLKSGFIFKKSEKLENPNNDSILPITKQQVLSLNKCIFKQNSDDEISVKGKSIQILHNKQKKHITMEIPFTKSANETDQ